MVKAIEDDGLIWNHVSNLKFWNDPTKLTGLCYSCNLSSR